MQLLCCFQHISITITTRHPTHSTTTTTPPPSSSSVTRVCGPLEGAPLAAGTTGAVTAYIQLLLLLFLRALV
jgi:hypothetical protein